MGHNRKINKILINKKFQLNFLAIFGGLICIISAIYSIAVYMSFRHFYELGHTIGLSDNHNFFKFLDTQSESLFLFFGVTFIFVLVVFLYIGLKLSHQVAGPLHRLNTHMEAMAIKDPSLNLETVKFRDNDYFLELADNFNRVVANENTVKSGSAKETFKKEA